MYESIGERLRRLRKEKNLTQIDVCNALHVTNQTLSKYEKGTISNIPYDKIISLAQIYHVSPEYIMGWESKSQTIAEPLEPYGTPPDLKDILKSGSILFDGVNHAISKEDGEFLANIFLTIANKREENNKKK